MAKKIIVKKKAAGKTKIKALVLPELAGKGWFFIRDFRVQAVIISVIAIVFYMNTYKNYYALDDEIILNENMYVQKGFAGIGEILSNDAYKSYYQSQGVEQQLSGGRYRPLSVITFAIEQQLFGQCYGQRFSELRDSITDYQKQGINDQRLGNLINARNQVSLDIRHTNFKLAPLRHVFQVLWFVLSLVVLLYFLHHFIFRANTDIAFLSVLLFAIHPIHTEVVANVKSRDEIFSLLFITLSFIYYFKYDLWHRRKDMYLGGASFFLALLSKEYAVVLIALLPISVMIFHKRTFRQAMTPLIPFGVVLFGYFMVRLSTVGMASAPVNMKNQDVLNDPYMYAKSDELRFASKVNRLDDYLWLLIWPATLVSDYSYAHFPYSHMLDAGVWLSILVYAGLVWITWKLWKQRHPLAFPLIFYFAFFMMINNMVFDIGATMGERLIYHSSLGFCMAAAWLIIKGLEKINSAQNIILVTLCLAICIPAYMVTVKRNREWRDDFSLFGADVKKHPNSALTNGNAGAQLMNYGLWFRGRDTIIGRDTIKDFGKDTVKLHRYADSAEKYLAKATTIHKRYVNGFLNLGLTYYYRDRYEEAAEAWGNAWQYFPSNQMLKDYEQMLEGRATEYVKKGDYAGTERFMKYAVTAVPGDANAWGDYAGSSFMAMDFPTAQIAFQKAMNLDNSKTNALRNGYLASAYNGRMLRAYSKDTTNIDTAFALAQGYMGTQQFYPQARQLLNKVHAARPLDSVVNKYYDSLGKLEIKAKAKPKAPLKLNPLG
ncbi:MAG: glycosyltransferase family 39 protein [Bacteroidetes bacterium]|nr:glycosyltransferase family 39 protein [Bacteroidota bacterium]